MGLWMEFWDSSEFLFPQAHANNKVLYLLILGPIAVLGDATGLLGQAVCFFCSGVALIPCAERLSWVTEQVAGHTNGTIGALLNATFGNAPELLISVSALRAGYYRIVQLTMLGSMLTNMLLVFGVSCIIGGVHWHVQELRVTSGNSNVVMLLVATAGSLFPAALVLPGQFEHKYSETNVPSPSEVAFCRFNAFIMLVLYLCFLVFQLASHKDEFDEELLKGNRKARRNMWCLAFLSSPYTAFPEFRRLDRSGHRDMIDDLTLDEEEQEGLIIGDSDDSDVDSSVHRVPLSQRRQLKLRQPISKETTAVDSDSSEFPELVTRNSLAINHASNNGFVTEAVTKEDPVISMRIGIIWLFIITLCISAMSDILVDSIEGFCESAHISEVFTSMVIIPFFSNVAEQVSAFIFAYRNEMDLCVGVTIGSAIQVATFVLPGSVLIGMALGRSMTLYFHAYETVCLLFSVIVTGAILQGGTTNWLTGVMLVGIYVMFAAGIWFHEHEDLTVDGEDLIQNITFALGGDVHY